MAPLCVQYLENQKPDLNANLGSRGPPVPYLHERPLSPGRKTEMLRLKERVGGEATHLSEDSSEIISEITLTPIKSWLNEHLTESHSPLGPKSDTSCSCGEESLAEGGWGNGPSGWTRAALPEFPLQFLQDRPLPPSSSHCSQHCFVLFPRIQQALSCLCQRHTLFPGEGGGCSSATFTFWQDLLRLQYLALKLASL